MNSDVNPHLNDRVNNFLSTLRVGIDFGETAGGVAIVRKNEIIHAETFVDFHDATLEQRRQLRRGRRTRHAKKMRLARLRSWVLRQQIPSDIPAARIKNKKTYLPDPYDVLQDKRYWVQPGIYQQRNKNPLESKSWIEFAEKGDVDASGFVRALTLIFKKRGYKYDDKDFLEYDAKRLIDFLNSCCLLKESPKMKVAIEEEIKRRSEIKEQTKLKEAFNVALDRSPQPRKAVPRQIKENELEKIISAFGKRYDLAPHITERWKKELVGLLNKVLRQPRFDNRLRSGCSWCGRKTPRLRKEKVRELALRAAVENIRVEENNRLRPLKEEEKEPFFEWWKKRIKVAAFAKGAKVPIAERAPTIENISKYLEQIGAAKSWIRNAKGRGRFDFPMLPQLNDLLNRTPKQGRAKLCMQHLRMASLGGFLCNRHLNSVCKIGSDLSHEKLDIISAVHGRYNAPNPKREQHDLRVLKRLENLLFNKNQKGEDSWRYGPVSFISLEVPEPQTERTAEREQTERKTLTVRQRIYQETGGTCIYCGNSVSLENMEMEHIVPKAKNGPDIQINRIASCRKCNHPDTGKGGRLPREWLSGLEWQDFEKRVATLPLPEFKKMLLLLKQGENFPDDPSSLARVGARTGAFVEQLQELFKGYGVEPPELTYVLGKPHVQIIRGRWTKDIRMSWLFKDRDARKPNFPRKDRTDLFNHAQDAALLAATPPHTWRRQIFVEEAVRPCVKRDEKGNIKRNRDGNIETELRQRPCVALLSLAPDWVSFFEKRTSSLVRILGKTKISWHRQFMDLSFYQDPHSLDSPFLKIRKSLDSPSSNGQRRKITKVPKGGLVIKVPHKDRTTGKRKVQVKPAHIAAILWRDVKGRLKISREYPMPIRKFVSKRMFPPIPTDASIVGRLYQGQVIHLGNGFYRVKEFPKDGVIIILENAITDAIATRLKIPKNQRKTLPEKKLGTEELCAYFETKLK